MSADHGHDLLLALLTEGRELTLAVRDHLEQGRFDRLPDLFIDRERCLRAVQQELRARDPRLDPETAARLEALRQLDRDVMRWLAQEKQLVLGALSSLHGQRIDPYADQGFTAPVALDQRH